MNYAIITLDYERGLYYLGQSLRRHLESEGHTVKYVLHSKQAKPINSGEFTDVFYELENAKRIKEFVDTYQIDTVISCEETSFDRAKIFRKYVKQMIDIPMMEQVKRSNVESGCYNIYDKIWCVSGNTYDFFANKFGYRGVALFKQWDFVDRNLFYPDKVKRSAYKFFHAAGWGGQYDRKNTETVIEAFARMSEYVNSTLSIYSQAPLPKIKCIPVNDLRRRIYPTSGTVPRKEIADMYRNCDCVLNPALREGLGLTFYEAHACGKPVISINAPPMDLLGDALVPVSRSVDVPDSYVPLTYCDPTALADVMKKAARDGLKMVGAGVYND